MKDDKKRVNIVVRKEDHEKWKEHAGDTGQSVSELVRRSVNRSLEKENLESQVNRVESKLDLLLDHLGVRIGEVTG